MRRGTWRGAWVCPAVGVVVMLLVPSSSRATGFATAFAIEGVDQARILAPAGAHVQPYHNVGYSLEWIGDEVRVEVDTSPLTSSSRYSLPTSPIEALSSDPVARLARNLATGADTHYEAISRILGWVARNIEYNLDRNQGQDAVAVLERRAGYCTGIARLTVSLLNSVGIEAR